MRSAAFLVAVFIAFSAPAATHAASPVSWYAALDLKNPEYLEVDLDLSGLQSNALLTSASFTVRYYDDASRVIGTQTFTSFSNDPLAGGSVYRRYFLTPYPTAGGASGLSLTSTVQTSGSEFMTLPHGTQTTPKGVPGIPRTTGPITASSRPPLSAQTLGDGPKPLLRLRLPEDGVRNNNSNIGPFCCTGVTAQVHDSKGAIVGYIYAFDLRDAVNLPDNTSAAGRLSVLLSAEAAAGAAGDGGRVQGQADFDAATWRPGDVRTVRVGPLIYRVTLLDKLRNAYGVNRLDLGSAQADVRVGGVR